MQHIKYIAVIAGLLLTHGCSQVRGDRIHVYVAASAAHAIEKVVRQENLDFVRVNSAASSTLARQIDRKAPAHIFVSADVAWMEWLAKRGRLAEITNRPLLKNQLVAVAHKPEFKWPPVHSDEFRIALGDPAHVPAGRYAKHALQNQGLWKKFKSNMVTTSNVRVALALVERGEVDYALVYRTDALSSNNASIVAEFPLNETLEIIYPIAVIKGQTSKQAMHVYRVLLKAQTTYNSLGFQEPS